MSFSVSTNHADLCKEDSTPVCMHACACVCIYVCLLPQNLLHIPHENTVSRFFVVFSSFFHYVAFTGYAIFKSSGIIRYSPHLPHSLDGSPENDQYTVHWPEIANNLIGSGIVL